MGRRRKREWFDREGFWRDFYPSMFSEERFAEAEGEVDKLLALTQSKGKAVLDLCCGPGRCAIPLAQRGFAVTGVDKTPLLLEKGKARARAAKAKIEWIEQDMRDFVRPGAFDLAINMFTSFGYFDEKEEDRTVLRNIFTCLKPQGTLVIESVGKEWLAKILEPIMSERLPDGSTIVRHQEILDDWTRIRSEWMLIRKGRAKSYTISHTIYSGQELKERLREAGFREVRLYGSLDGTPYDQNARRLVAVGEKE